MGKSEWMVWNYGPLAGIAAAAQHLAMPDGVRNISQEIPGPAFFPGGRGLVDANLHVGTVLPIEGVMVLGHNFGKQRDYDDAKRRGGEVQSNATWRRMRELFCEAGIGLEECFFTNALIGLLAKGANRGRHPNHDDPCFQSACRDLLQRQIYLQQPRLVLSLGRHVPSIMTSLSPNLAAWTGHEKFASLDKAGPVCRATFGTHETAIVALVHPSYRHLTAHCRRYLHYTGHKAELEMIREGRRIAGGH